jgi:membrane-associated phospholipid phosphatase
VEEASLEHRLAAPETGSPTRSTLIARRSALTAGLIVFFALGYYAIGLSVDPDRARTLATPLDAAVPFAAASIYVYAWTYTALLFPLFAVRCPRLFDRVALAYAIVIALALPCFLLFPVTAVPLRAATSTLDPTRFAEWGVLLNYHLDPPFNLFPSIHMAIVTVAVGSAWKARREYGVLAACAAAAIAVSICTVKQHYVLDAVAGLALGLGAWAAAVRPYRATPEDEPVAFGWRGPGLYLLLHGSVYAALYGVFRTGWTPG